MKLSTAYNLKSTTVSDSTKATVKAGNNAPTGTQQLNIIKVAQAGYLTGAQTFKQYNNIYNACRTWLHRWRCKDQPDQG